MAEEDVALAVLADAEGDEVAVVQLQIGPAAADHEMEREFVMDVELRSFTPRGALRMRGAEGLFDSRPQQAARNLVLL